MSQINSIKYLEGSLKHMSYARADLFFFTRIKALFPQGYIKRSKSFLSLISESINESKSTCSIRIGSLLERGFIKAVYKDNKLVGYQLLSYNNFWKKIGYIKKENNVFKGGFKIIKIDFDKAKNKKDLIDTIHKFEIIQKSKKINYKKNKLNGASRPVGAFFQLSCQGFSDIFGYKSGITGHNIKKKLSENGIIEIEKVDPILIRRSHILTYIEQKKSERNYSLKRGIKFTNKEFFCHQKDGFGFVFERKCHFISLAKYKNQSSYKANLLNTLKECQTNSLLKTF